MQIVICLWNRPYYTHSKQRSLNSSKVLCLCIMTSCFPARFQFICLIKTGTYQFIQNYASYCFLMFLTSSQSKVLFMYFFFSFSSSTFQPSPSLRRGVASASTKGFRTGKVLPWIFLCYRTPPPDQSLKARKGLKGPVSPPL